MPQNDLEIFPTRKELELELENLKFLVEKKDEEIAQLQAQINYLEDRLAGIRPSLRTW